MGGSRASVGSVWGACGDSVGMESLFGVALEWLFNKYTDIVE